MTFGDALVTVLAVGGWICGIVLAKGFWITFGAVLVPPLAWCLLAASILARMGIT